MPFWLAGSFDIPAAVSLRLLSIPQQIIQSFHYDPVHMNYTIEGKTYANLFEYSFSPNGDYLIYVASQLDEDPEAYLYNRNTNNHFRLTENEYFIESQVCVDDNANRAFILTETSNSISKVFCNEALIVDNGFLNRSLCFWKDKLFFASWDISSRTSQFCLYDLVSGKTEVLTTVSYATGLSAAAGDVILIEAYDILNDADIVLSIRPGDNSETIVEQVGDSDSFLCLRDGEIYVEQVSGDSNAIYLFNAYYWLNKYQSAEPWSGSADSAGRISWNESYRLLGMVELWKKTGDETIKFAIASAVHRLLATREAAYQAGSYEIDQFLFVTKKYSIDESAELRLIVNNAMVYWSMLLCANAGCLNEEDYQALISMAESAFRYYEEDWDPNSSCYRFRKGEPFWADGVVVPFNQQNAFGLALLELWKATGKTAYQDRCMDLAQTFVKEIEFTEDGRALWHYWPREYYKGWTEAESISQNTPSQVPIESLPYEDSSHAILSALFISNYYETFGDVFSESLLQSLRNTLTSLCTDNGCSSILEPLNTNKPYLGGPWAMLLPSGDKESTFSQRFLRRDFFSM